MRMDGSQVTQLTDGPFVDRGPVFSPDGRNIAFSRAGAGKNPDVYAMRADGSGVHLVYRSRGRSFSDFAPDWGRKPSS
jgi:Tol biopolymer transport system component